MNAPPKILIVDDERFNINVLTELLKPSYKIMAAINGTQALKAVASNPPDLILLDVMMPDMDGYEVCRRLKADESTRDIPVIFVTAMGQESDETKGLELGAADYLTKPISPAILEARVKTQLERMQNHEKLKEAYAIINKQKERMQEELNVGRDIQLGMLPQVFPPFPDHREFSIHASMNAANEVGGDFYDFFFIDEDHLCFCVGDVSGKGVPAALFMAISKAMIKSRAADDLSTASVFTHVNDELATDNDSMMFVTVFIAVLDIRTGDLSYTNGGHNPPYIKRENGDITRLDQRHGPALGPFEGATYKEEKNRMEKGDLLLLYTDGVTEAMNPERMIYEEERLVNVLARGNYTEPDQVINAVAADIEKFTDGAEQFDDITMLAISFHKVAVEGAVKSFDTVIKNQLSEMRTVLANFDAFVDHNEIPFGAAQKIKLALDEMLNNIISYGFVDDEEHEIMVFVERFEDRLLAKITDDGIPFNPFKHEEPDLESSLEERQIGGLGIHLVRNLMDDVSYKRGIGKNVVTLIKYIGS